jgi:hypothetical protein
MNTISFVSLFAAAAVAAATPGFAATVAHQGFDPHPFVSNLLTGAGHTSTSLSAADIETGALLSGGFDVFVMSRNAVACAGPSAAYADAVHAFILAGGNVVTEWAGGPMFFTSDAPGVFCPGSTRLGTFAGVVHAGSSRGVGSAIDITSPSHPLAAGLSDPMTDGQGTDYMYWIENPDPRLQVLGQVTGTGGEFPTGEQLPVILTGCRGDSRFVFGLHDWNDTIDTSSVAQTFLLNAVDVAAEGCTPCPLEPAPGCLTAEKSSIQVRNDDNDEKDSIKWKLSKGEALEQSLLGAPEATRTYALCIYDESGATYSRVASVVVGPGPLWLSRDPKGFKYTDKAGSQDGATKISLKTGDAGRSSVQFAAKGLGLALPAPASANEMFDQDTRVVVQLLNDESSLCFTSEFESASRNTPESFKASAP